MVRTTPAHGTGNGPWPRSVAGHLQLPPCLLVRRSLPTDESRYVSQATFFNRLAGVPGLHLRLGRLEEHTPKWHRALRSALQRCGVDQSDFEAHFKFAPELHQKGVDALITLDLVRLA